jgi:hypothetical protein
MSPYVRLILRAADTDPAITFTSFRHGGLTELGDADLTDAQIRAVSRHKSPKVLSPRLGRRRDPAALAGALFRRRRAPRKL